MLAGPFLVGRGLGLAQQLGDDQLVQHLQAVVDRLTLHVQDVMLVIYAYGTNCGIRQMISGAHAHSEEDLRYVRHWHVERGSVVVRSQTLKA
jgi:hypothetical protein